MEIHSGKEAALSAAVAPSGPRPHDVICQTRTPAAPGADVTAAATVVSVVGLASIGGKIGWGTLTDHAGSEVAFTLSSLCVVAAIGILALTSPAASFIAYV